MAEILWLHSDISSIIMDNLAQNKRNDKSIEQYTQYLVNGIAIGTPEKVMEGISKYVDIGVR